MKTPRITALAMAIAASVFAYNQILPDFQADPSARVFDGTLYIYPSHDGAGARDWSKMVDWHVFSSKDTQTWTDHGKIFGLNDITWADTNAWAPDCIERGGKYYFYFPAGGQIGVAVSDSPTGPFKDALGRPLVKKGEAGIRYMIDPNVFIDDDGQAYLFVGGGRQLGVVKLKEDMLTRDGDVQPVEMEGFYEGVWVHKHAGTYYASYPTRPAGSRANVMLYSTAKSPLGPWQLAGQLIDNDSHNVHGSITEYNGQWQLFYHVEGPSAWERRVCMEPLIYGADGSLEVEKVKYPAAGFFERLKDGKKQSVVVYGTSLSHHAQWVNALEAWLGEQYPGQITFANKASSGKHSGWGVQNLSRVLEQKPDLVFMEFSMNDSATKHNISREQAITNLDNMVSRLHEQNPEAEIVLQVMNTVYDADDGKLSASARPELEAYCEDYRIYAGEHKLALIDHYPAWDELRRTEPEKYKSWLPDGTHPTPEGSLAVTWNKVRWFLEKSRDAASK